MTDEELQAEIDKCNAELMVIHAKINVLLEQKQKFAVDRKTLSAVQTEMNAITVESIKTKEVL